MKTAMQELITELERVRLMTNMNFVIRIATDLLEKEKEQIIEAVNYGNRQDHYDATEVELSNYYYEQTYNQNK